MNEIEKLNERIAQLTELVKTGSEAIKNMETALKAAEEERDRLADQRREQEPMFERVESRSHYYCIDSRPIGMVVCSESEDHTNVDNGYYVSDEVLENHLKQSLRLAENKSEEVKECQAGLI